MLYESTRSDLNKIRSAEAIKKGIAPDNGLFVPERTIKFSLEKINILAGMTYRERAVEILKDYLDDYSLEEIQDAVNCAYAHDKFDSLEIAPVFKLNENVGILELWHGPTCAFKDMALQILPHLLVKAMRKTGELNEIIILVATSGDTGKAALDGFKDVEGTRVIVFYPANGVSEIQKMQMITQEGRNVCTVAVEGNFDDAQNGVKAIFSDSAMAEKMQESGFKFSSANSINWGRLVPQIVYYFSAYADLLKRAEIKCGDEVNFVVPTGNFGNILAGYYAKEMGLPVGKLICASNENNVLTEFINTGTYDRNRDFKKTLSPSMDILISSNLERLLYEITEHNKGAVGNWMSQLKNNGIYRVTPDVKKKISKLFWADNSNDAETLKTIECIYNEYNYLVDTHTAVAIDVYDKYVISTGDMTKTVIVSTASPFKFNQSVAKAILGDKEIQGKSEFQLLEELSERTGMPIPSGLAGLDKKEIRHKSLCGKDTMKRQIESILGI